MGETTSPLSFRLYVHLYQLKVTYRPVNKPQLRRRIGKLKCTESHRLLTCLLSSCIEECHPVAWDSHGSECYGVVGCDGRYVVGSLTMGKPLVLEKSADTVRILSHNSFESTRRAFLFLKKFHHKKPELPPHPVWRLSNLRQFMPQFMSHHACWSQEIRKVSETMSCAGRKL